MADALISYARDHAQKCRELKFFSTLQLQQIAESKLQAKVRLGTALKCVTGVAALQRRRGVGGVQNHDNDKPRHLSIKVRAIISYPAMLAPSAATQFQSLALVNPAEPLPPPLRPTY